MRLAGWDGRRLRVGLKTFRPGGVLLYQPARRRHGGGDGGGGEEGEAGPPQGPQLLLQLIYGESGTFSLQTRPG